MKAMRILAGLALVASLGLNAWLWQQRAAQLAATEAARASAAEAEALRTENEALKSQSAPRPASSEADMRELARLRNEVSQLRNQSKGPGSPPGKELRETTPPRPPSAATLPTPQVTEPAPTPGATTNQQSPAVALRMQALQCLSNLKHIGMAAQVYCQGHKNVFPPDLASLRNELKTVGFLFCPGASGDTGPSNWDQLDPATISYQYLNPNGTSTGPNTPLTYCPLHGWMGMSDGTVQERKN